MPKRNRVSFEYPTPRSARKGARLSTGNAERHLHCANLLAEGGEHATACGHLVLAVEEAVKAQVLVGFSRGILQKKDLAGVLRRHETRHGAAIWGAIGRHVLSVMLEEIGDLVGRRRKLPRDEVIKRRKRVVARLIADFEDATAAGDKHALVYRLAWLSGMQQLRERAFYVDYDKRGWHDPRQVTESSYRSGFEITQEIVEETREILTLRLPRRVQRYLVDKSREIDRTSGREERQGMT